MTNEATVQVKIKSGHLVTVTPAQAEKMKPHVWYMHKEGRGVAASIKDKSISLPRFLYDVSDRSITVRRHDTYCLDFSPNNVYLWENKKRHVIPFDHKTQPAMPIDPPTPTPPTPAPQSRVLTPPPSPAITRPMFIDIDGAGMIVSASAIARIDLTDPDVVEVELLSQQFAETGRDTKPTSYVYEGDAARHVRLWAMALADTTGAKLIDLVITLQNEVADLQAKNKTLTANGQSKHDTLITKLRAIGFDPNKLV